MAAGRVLCHRGAALIVLEGVATVESPSQLSATLGRGALFGEAASLPGSPPRDAKVVAATAMAVLVLSRAEFETAITTAPAFAENVRRLREQPAVGAPHTTTDLSTTQVLHESSSANYSQATS
ncbi:MAG: cyclic nucleotide-binding domain-containing protein [Acidimicrobiia bacterium]